MAICNAKLAELVDKVEKTHLQAVANDEFFGLLVKPKRVKAEASKLIRPLTLRRWAGRKPIPE